MQSLSEVLKKQFRHDTGLKTKTKILVGYKSRKEESPEYFVGLIPCVRCQFLSLIFSKGFLKTTVLFIVSPAGLQVSFVGLRLVFNMFRCDHMERSRKEMPKQPLQKYNTCLHFLLYWEATCWIMNKIPEATFMS